MDIFSGGGIFFHFSLITFLFFLYFCTHEYRMGICITDFCGGSVGRRHRSGALVQGEGGGLPHAFPCGFGFRFVYDCLRLWFRGGIVLARTPLGCVPCGSAGGVRHRFHRCGYHYLPQKRACGARSDDSGWSLGHCSHRTGMRRRYVRALHRFHHSRACRSRGIQNYPRQVRQASRQ